MKRTVAALILVLALALPGHAARDPGVTADEAQEFQLGFALQAPAALTEIFLQSVRSLKDINNEAASARQVSKLADQSKALRALEARAYAQVSQMLHAMGAPPKLQSWASTKAALFAAPLVLSQEAKDSLRSDPNTATVLATIDEAQSVKAEAKHADAQSDELDEIDAWPGRCVDGSSRYSNIGHGRDGSSG